MRQNGRDDVGSVFLLNGRERRDNRHTGGDALRAATSPTIDSAAAVTSLFVSMRIISFEHPLTNHQLKRLSTPSIVSTVSSLSLLYRRLPSLQW